MSRSSQCNAQWPGSTLCKLGVSQSQYLQSGNGVSSSHLTGWWGPNALFSVNFSVLPCFEKMTSQEPQEPTASSTRLCSKLHWSTYPIVDGLRGKLTWVEHLQGKPAWVVTAPPALVGCSVHYWRENWISPSLSLSSFSCELGLVPNASHTEYFFPNSHNNPAMWTLFSFLSSYLWMRK